MGVSSMKPKLRDNLVYLSVGGLLFATLATFILYSANTKGRIPSIPPAILWAALSSPVLVALVLEHFWRFRRDWRLWALVSMTLLGNLVLVLIAQGAHLQPSLAVWTLLAMAWLSTMLFLGHKFVSRDTGPNK